jgi:hypothetical protein
VKAFFSHNYNEKIQEVLNDLIDNCMKSRNVDIKHFKEKNFSMIIEGSEVNSINNGYISKRRKSEKEKRKIRNKFKLNTLNKSNTLYVS